METEIVEPSNNNLEWVVKHLNNTIARNIRFAHTSIVIELAFVSTKISTYFHQP